MPQHDGPDEDPALKRGQSPELSNGTTLIKIVVAGKGGVGKSTTSALLSRAFADLGHQVLAFDLDSSPGLAISLGAPADDNPVPAEILEEAPEAAYGWSLAPAYDASTVVDRHSFDVGGGIRFLSFGNIAEARNNLRRFVRVSWQVAGDFERDGWVMIADLEAGPTTPFEGIARFASIVVVLVEATPASILAARRIASILEHDGTDFVWVVSKGIDASDENRIAEELGIPTAVVPWDTNVRQAEKMGSLMDLEPSTPALEAARGLAGWIDERVSAKEGAR